MGLFRRRTINIIHHHNNSRSRGTKVNHPQSPDQSSHRVERRGGEETHFLRKRAREKGGKKPSGWVEAADPKPHQHFFEADFSSVITKNYPHGLTYFPPLPFTAELSCIPPSLNALRTSPIVLVISSLSEAPPLILLVILYSETRTGTPLARFPLLNNRNHGYVSTPLHSAHCPNLRLSCILWLVLDTNVSIYVQRPQSRKPRRCLWATSWPMRVCPCGFASSRGWTVLIGIDFGSWADEMEDMPLPGK